MDTPDTLRLVVSPTRSFRITKRGLPDAVCTLPQGKVVHESPI